MVVPYVTIIQESVHTMGKFFKNIVRTVAQKWMETRCVMNEQKEKIVQSIQEADMEQGYHTAPSMSPSSSVEQIAEYITRKGGLLYELEEDKH